MAEHFDVVVCGAGSSGGVAASRLSDDPSRRVLLLEAGLDFPEEAEFPPGFVSGGFQFQWQYAAEHDWGYWSEPLPQGRRMRIPRGKLVGGSSMTNATMFVRGAPADFERWQAAGATGWTYDYVASAYEAVESIVPIKRYPRDGWQPVQAAFRDALVELGYREQVDMNSPDAWYGTVGATPVNRKNEMRQGTLVTYVRRARGRPNFEVRGQALVDRVLVDGDRVRGVRYLDASGAAHEVEADLVVLSGGVYGSPAVLLRSGIGPEAHLRELGLEVAAPLPVGAQLLDHGLCYWHIEAPGLAEIRGPSTAMVVRAHDNEWFAVITVIDEETSQCGIAFVSTGDNRGGHLRLASADPSAAPLITHTYEVGPFAGCDELVDRALALAPFRGARNLDAGRSVQEIFDERTGTCYHPCGTCAIGQVVGPDLRVLGFENLYVADASVFPCETSNNTNETCYAVGEILARVVEGKGMP